MKGCECHAGLARTPTGGVETVVAVGARRVEPMAASGRGYVLGASAHLVCDR